MWSDLAPVGRAASSGGYFRQPFTTPERELSAWFVEQCVARGLRVESDVFGNVVGWWEAPSLVEEGALRPSRNQAVLTGSHLDSVLDGGAYDGPLGVVSALAAIDLLRDRGSAPSTPIGVAVFAEDAMAARGLEPQLGRADWLSDVGCYLELHVEQGRDLVHRDAPVGLASAI